MATRPYQASYYLNDPQDKAAYLNEALASGDMNAFLTALNNLTAAEATPNLSASTPENFYPDLANMEDLMTLVQLNTLLHSLGLNLMVTVNPELSQVG